MHSFPKNRIRTICGFCHTNCGLAVTVKEGEITEISGDLDHPVNKGDICPKGIAGKQIVTSSDRLSHPLRKVRAGFRRVSWDEALDFISTGMMEICEQYGAETIFRGGGAPVTEENRDAFSQLTARLGSVNYIGVGHICHQPRALGFRSVCGHMPQPDYQNTKLILVWGANPTASRRYGEVGAGFAPAYGKFTELLPPRMEHGVKMIVIDPWRNRLAERADKWIQIEPGRDDALALSMLHVIIKRGLYDKKFVEQWTEGFEHLSDHIETFTPVWAEKITRVKANDIEEIAELYATTKPATIREGNAIDQYTNAVQTTRAIAMLEAITGNIDRKGGNVFFPFPRLTSNIPPSKIERLSAAHYPLFPSVPFPSFADAMTSGRPYRPRALIINHSNTLLVHANTPRTRQVLKKLKLLVVCDIFPTATTALADIILPEASPFERYGFRGYAGSKGGFVALRRKVIEPVGESRSMLEVEYELAKRMGLADGYPFSNNSEWISHRLGASRITFDELDREQIVTTTPPMRYEKYLKEGFHTPSGKIELFSNRLKEAGHPPMPSMKDPDATFSTLPASRERFPLIGTTRRPDAYTHTQFRNIPDLRNLDPECLLRIHPIDALARGIRDREMTRVESPGGSVHIRAKVTDEIGPGIILMDFGWGNPGDGGVNVNQLTGDEDRDPISCSTPNHRFRCQVRKYSGS